MHDDDLDVPIRSNSHALCDVRPPASPDAAPSFRSAPILTPLVDNAWFRSAPGSHLFATWDRADGSDPLQVLTSLRRPGLQGPVGYGLPIGFAIAAWILKTFAARPGPLPLSHGLRCYRADSRGGRAEFSEQVREGREVTVTATKEPTATTAALATRLKKYSRSMGILRVFRSVATMYPEFEATAFRPAPILTPFATSRSVRRNMFRSASILTPFATVRAAPDDQASPRVPIRSNSHALCDHGSCVGCACSDPLQFSRPLRPRDPHRRRYPPRRSDPLQFSRPLRRPSLQGP